MRLRNESEVAQFLAQRFFQTAKLTPTIKCLSYPTYVGEHWLTFFSFQYYTPWPQTVLEKVMGKISYETKTSEGLSSDQHQNKL